MLKLLKNFFETSHPVNDDKNEHLELICGLMIEAANSDGNIDENEIKKIKEALINIFKESPDDVDITLDKAIKNKNNSKSLYFYTSKINKEYTEEKKILLIETLWGIIVSDGKVHDYESSLIRRISGLLYISDVNSGNARKRALNKYSK